jgi:hypothetical protein
MSGGMTPTALAVLTKKQIGTSLIVHPPSLARLRTRQY